MRAPTALFLHSPVGGAHLVAGRAVAAAWHAQHAGWQSEEIDYLRFLPSWERRLWTGLYHASLRYCPALWRGYYRFTNRPSEPRLFRERVSDLGAEDFAARLDHERPALVVSTIGAAAALAGAARTRCGLRFVNALVVTGFGAHRHQARPEADVVFVAHPRVKRDLIGHGLLAERIFVYGTPVRAAARRLTLVERRLQRVRLGLPDTTAPLLLVASGATGAYRSFDALLRTLARLGRRLEVVTFKGTAAPFEQRGPIRLWRLGPREDFCDYLAASDLIVGKLGGMQAAEACAAGVPVVVYEPIPGQEEANAEVLLEAGAALWPRSAAQLADVLTRLLSDEGAAIRARMSHAASSLSRPAAATRIVEHLATLLEASR